MVHVSIPLLRQLAAIEGTGAGSDTGSVLVETVASKVDRGQKPVAKGGGRDTLHCLSSDE